MSAANPNGTVAIVDRASILLGFVGEARLVTLHYSDRDKDVFAVRFDLPEGEETFHFARRQLRWL